MLIDNPQIRGMLTRLMVLSLLIVGCSSGEKPIKLNRVSGSLTIAGKPAANIIVHFEPATGRPSTGITNDKGNFEMRYEKDRAGVLHGEHKVWIEYRPTSPAEEMAIREGKSPLSPEVQAALQKYDSAKTTSLSQSINEDKKDLKLDLQ